MTTAADPLAAFLEAVATGAAPRVPAEEAREALALALRIIEEMERHSRLVEATLAARRP